MQRTLVLVGGFLGAGKTTLLLEAATRLQAEGRRVAIVTNDQGDELVDTRMARARGFETGEVKGGCFCVRLSDLMRATERLKPDIIFAEPVGSAANLSATVLRPIRQAYGDRFHLAPLTVLVDPGRAEQLLSPGADPDLAYVFRRQLAEADLVRFTKADQYPSLPELPGVEARPISAYTGEGMSEWLAEVLNPDGASGMHPLEIDHQRYAQAEAALGWLNWGAELRLRKALTPAAVAGPLIERLERLLSSTSAKIGHLKILAVAETGYLKISICGNGNEPCVDGLLDAPPALRHDLILNLRAKADPIMLESLVEQAVAELPGRLVPRSRQAFRPAAPVPQQNFVQLT